MNRFDTSNQIAQELNLKSEKGFITKKELEEWAENQNKSLICIRWVVKMVESNINGVEIPKLFHIKYI